MSSMLLESRCNPTAEIVRRRLLPVPGEVTVRVGDHVQPDDIVAHAPVVAATLLIDISQALGVSVHAIERVLRVRSGDRVERGSILASTSWFGLRRRNLLAPRAGIVQGIEDGCLFLRQEVEMLRLRAYLPGEVVESYPHRGVGIRTLGSLIRGVWGAGPHSSGVLAMGVESPEDILSPEHLERRHRDAIVVGGRASDPLVIQQAAQVGARALVLGSAPLGLCQAAQQLGYPLMVTEGAGDTPMAEPIHSLLVSRQGLRAVMSGAMPSDQLVGPELIVPQAAEPTSRALMVLRPIQPGCQVRLTRAPYQGLIAPVVSLSNTPQRTELGAWVVGADVQLPNGRIVFVPFSNMELIA